MGYRSTADKKLEEVKEAIKLAFEKLLEAINTNTRGSEYFYSEKEERLFNILIFLKN